MEIGLFHDRAVKNGTESGTRIFSTQREKMARRMYPPSLSSTPLDSNTAEADHVLEISGIPSRCYDCATTAR